MADVLLKKYCDQLAGVIVGKYQCPRTRLHMLSEFCILRDRYAKRLFFDGCSGPTGPYRTLFYPACIKHDLCYHHEPATNGYRRLDCDNQFLTNLKEKCLEARNQDQCRVWSELLYKGVRNFGQLAFNCANSVADYDILDFYKYARVSELIELK